MKEKVLQWLSSGCDYNQGLALLSQTGKHKNLIRSITGRPARYAAKLKVELLKSAGLPYITQPPQQEKLPEKLPEIVEKVIREHSETFLLRSRLHEQLRSLPPDNDPSSVKQRKNLSDSLSLLSARIELLFAAKEAWYNEGLLPDAAILFPQPPSACPDSACDSVCDSACPDSACDSARPASACDSARPASACPASARPLTRASERASECASERASDPRASDTLPTTPQELKKLKKNLQTSNTKDQNFLEYQDISKADKPNPMPSGPKKLKLENRIKTRLAQIEQIDYKLLKT